MSEDRARFIGKHEIADRSLITVKHERRSGRRAWTFAYVLIVETPCQLSMELLIYPQRENR